MAKSRFSGGTLGNGRWDEEEHPRDKDGRFASGGGGGTSRASEARKKLLANIKRKIENGEPTTDYERELAIKHILPKGERADFTDDDGGGGTSRAGAEETREQYAKRAHRDWLHETWKMDSRVRMWNPKPEEKIQYMAMRNRVLGRYEMQTEAKQLDRAYRDWKKKITVEHERGKAIDRFERKWGFGSWIKATGKIS